jgi:hypothetical protein
MARNPELPHIVGKGVTPVVIPLIDQLAEAYVKERDKRLKLTPREVAAKGKLIDALHANKDKLESPDGTITYRYDEMTITLTPGKEKLRVTPIDNEDEQREE